MIIKQPAVFDTSYYELILDFAKVSPRPLAVCTKATEGGVIRDSKFLTYWADLKQDGIRRMCYHFHRKVVTESSQATNFINTVKAGGYTADDIFVLDIEEGGESATQIIAWLDLVESAFPKNRILIYSRKNILDPIAMTPTQAARLREHPVWTAGYPLNPDLFDTVPSDYIPNPAKWGPVWMWQYTEKAVVAGITGNVDANWVAPVFRALLGTVTLPATDVETHPYDGMKHITGTRSGWKFHLFILDPAKFDFELVSTPALETVKSVAIRKGATLATNAGEWNDRDASLSSYLKPVDYTVSNGQTIVTRDKIAARPSLQVLDYYNKIFIGHSPAVGVQQAFTGLRYLITNGVMDAALYGSEDKYTEGHARAIFGDDADGNLMVFLSEGVHPTPTYFDGLKLHEATAIMKQYGAWYAFDGGGGGDVGGVLDGQDLIKPENIVNGVNVYRALPMTFAVYVKGIPVMATYTIKSKLDGVKIYKNADGTSQIAALNMADTAKADALGTFIHLTSKNGSPLYGYVDTNKVTATADTVTPPPPPPPPVPADSIAVDIAMYDVKVIGDKYEAKGVKVVKVA